jgi:hypothetical protein
MSVMTPRRVLPVVVVVLVVAGVAAMFTRGGPASHRPPVVAGSRLEDPIAWTPSREPALVAAAARGTSHLLYTLSPGGAQASAARTARWRPLIVAAARRAGVPPDELEGLVLLESAGRADAVTPAGLDGAVGLTQIVAETGRDLLGMHVDVAASRQLTTRIQRALAAGRTARATALERRRAQVDQRFDPRASLAGSARYLVAARRRFGRVDEAVASYHMGMGNLEGVLRAYGGHPGYARVYFDSTPARHSDAWRRLASFGDDSSNYLWKVMAAEQIMRLWRTDRAALGRMAALQTSSDSAENVLHPPGSVRPFTSAAAIRSALADGTLLAVPDKPARTGLQPAGRAPLGLRPAALALTLYLGAQARALSHASPLIVTAAARPTGVGSAGFSEGPVSTAMHTTGWALDIRRSYRSPAQAQAFQFLLDRLQVLNVIAWVRERRTIHITVGPAAGSLLPLLDRVGLRAR